MNKTIKIVSILAVCLATVTSCKKDKSDPENLSSSDVHNHDAEAIPLDSTAIDPFFTKHAEFKEYESQIKELYKKHHYHYIWQDNKGIIEFANVLYNSVNQLDEEGLKAKLPYQEQITSLFYNNEGKKPDIDSEMLLSSMYFYYMKNVYEGVDAQESKETGWYLPREKVSYVSYLDTLMQDPGLIKGDKNELFSQYFSLKKALEKYREIEKKGGWGTITMEDGKKSIKPGDSSATIAQVRKRLAVEGYLKKDNGKAVFDDELLTAMDSYARRRNSRTDSIIGPMMMKDLNIPVAERIKTISVNMERCRWVPAEVNHKKEFIAVNIPSYWLQYIRDGKEVLHSRVVVGKALNKTVVFTGNMSYIAFSPYWNVPQSILEKEVKPGIAKDPNYLSKHNMEWVEGTRVRQKPGGRNSLGLVKFMFPNSNNIYLHDTPAKTLFNKDDRAFSHGCVRVQKARELAIAITGSDGNWSESRVDDAMHAGKENSYILKEKIPVYIVYFTAWADEDGNVAFFDDIYNRDDRLAGLLYKS